jgi:hypothetical protein
MLEKYRESMTEDVLHSWAKDAQVMYCAAELADCLDKAYSASPEGREYMKKLRAAIDA